MLSAKDARRAFGLLVIKYGRADDIAEMANTVMDVIGTEDIRIAITHEDIASSQDSFDPGELRRTLSSLLDIKESNIFSFGKDTPADVVRAFIRRTLHEPRSFKMSSEQQVAALGVGSRKMNKPINAVLAKILAAEVACSEATSQGRGYESDFLITTTQHATSEMVNNAKRDMFEAIDDYSEEQQNLLYGKAGVTLSLRLHRFVETTNKLLSYDVTDTSNPKNLYKKCNHCGAVWVKTEGCDGGTRCGNIPSALRAEKVLVTTEFVEDGGGRWTLLFNYGSISRTASATWSWFQSNNPFRTTKSNKGTGTTHLKRAGSVIESGCGNAISWSTMLPVPPEELVALKKVEPLKQSFPEESAKVLFENKVRIKELENRKILLDATV